MEENSIEEALEKLSTGKKIKMYELLRTLKKEGIENFVITRKKYVDVILSDYKRVLKENELLSRENRKLRTIKYDTAYGVESIHLITKRDLVEINTNKYFIEIQDKKFVDLKQVYQENEKLNEYKENYIPIEKVKDKIEEILNNKEYRIVFEGNAEFPDDATIINAQKYIKLEKMQELIEEREEK